MIGLLLLIFSASIVTATTYRFYNHTWDEPEHLAAGLHLLQTGEYLKGTEQPPPVRLLMGASLSVAGARSNGINGPVGRQEGFDILYRDGRYKDFLFAARLGVLPFLPLLILSTWLWARRYYDDGTAILTAGFVASTPAVIGHAAIAGLDVAMAATTTLALFFLLRWIETPTASRSISCGLACGLAFGTKLSAIPFIAATALIWLFADLMFKRKLSLKLLPHAILVVALASVVLVASYSFGNAWRITYDHGFPLPAAVSLLHDSISALSLHNKEGHVAYLLGEIRTQGWWYYYPVALVLKTPLPLLIAFCAGTVSTAIQCSREKNWMPAAPLLAITAILAFCGAFSRINIGVRHVIVVVPLMAIIASAYLKKVYTQFSTPLVRSFVPLIILWQCFIFFQSYPDYLPYFNELAGSTPEKILNDSDLDWGQDMHRLKSELRALKIKEFTLIYRGTMNFAQEDFPPFRTITPTERPTGWLAVALGAKEITTADGGYRWLDAYTPVKRIGKSIDLYYIPPN